MKKIGLTCLIILFSYNMYSQEIAIDAKKRIYEILCDRFYTNKRYPEDACKLSFEDFVENRFSNIEILPTPYNEIKVYYFYTYRSHSYPLLLFEKNNEFFLLDNNFNTMYFELRKLFYFLDLSSEDKLIFYEAIASKVFYSFDERYSVSNGYEFIITK